jgi:hypothetical protein
LYAGVPDLQGADRGPRAHLRRAYEPAGGANFSAPARLSKLFTRQLTAGPREVSELEVYERPPSTLRNELTTSPLWGATGRSGRGHHRSWRRRWRGPWGVLPICPAAATTEVGDIDGLAAGPVAGTTKVEGVDGGPPEGCCQGVGVLPAGPAAATTKVGDVDGGPPRGCCRHVRQRPPPKLETSMAGPLGGAADMSCSGHHRSWRRQWQALWGLLAAGPTVATTEVGASMAGPWGLLPVSPAAATTGPHLGSMRCKS